MDAIGLSGVTGPVGALAVCLISFLVGYMVGKLFKLLSNGLGEWFR